MQVTLDIPEKHFDKFISFIKTIEYVAIVEQDMLSQKGKAFNVEQIRKKYKNAYEPWTEEADDKLERFFCKGMNIQELSKLFARNVGAIESRIKKLELKEKYE